MFFTLSKIFWLLAQPVSLAFILALLGLLLTFTRWKWPARICVGLGALVLFLSAFTTLGYVMLRPLEAAFAPPAEAPVEVAGIIVLGGGMDSEINDARGGFELNRAGDRFLEGLRLAGVWPDAKVVITGGRADLDQQGEPEAVAGARFFTAMGIAPERIVMEPDSRNTAENAANTKALIDPGPDEVWLLVTSAFHMPRSVGLFRQVGFPVVPWPVDYRGTGDEGFGLTAHQPAENVAVTTLAIREWIGLLAYWLTGRIAEPLPGPNDKAGARGAPAAFSKAPRRQAALRFTLDSATLLSFSSVMISSSSVSSRSLAASCMPSCPAQVLSVP